MNISQNLCCFFLILCGIKSFGQTSQSPATLESLPSPYTLVDEPKEFKILSKNSLLMTAGKETDLHNPANGSYIRHNAPKFLFTPDKDFDFSAFVKPQFD